MLEARFLCRNPQELLATPTERADTGLRAVLACFSALGGAGTRPETLGRVAESCPCGCDRSARPRELSPAHTAFHPRSLQREKAKCCLLLTLCKECRNARFIPCSKDAQWRGDEPLKGKTRGREETGAKQRRGRNGGGGGAPGGPRVHRPTTGSSGSAEPPLRS